MIKENISLLWPDIIVTGKIGNASDGELFEARPAGNPQGTAEAIKVITIPLSGEQGQTTAGLIAAEVKRQAALNHKNIAAVRDVKVVRKQDDSEYYVCVRMEYLVPFSFYQASRVLSENEIIKVGTEISAAVEWAAAAGIVHGDIRPDNILMDLQGNFKLDGFGVWPILQEKVASMRNQNMLLYLAPEVFKGAAKSESTDIYAIGLVLYTFANGNYLPYKPVWTDVMAIGRSISERANGQKLPELTGISERLAGVIECAVAAKPEDRFAKAAALKNALASCNQVSVAAPAPGAASRASVSPQPAYQAPQPAKAKAAEAVNNASSEKKKNTILPIIIIAAGVVLAALIAVGIIFGSKLITNTKRISSGAEEITPVETIKKDVITDEEAAKSEETTGSAASSGTSVLQPKDGSTVATIPATEAETTVNGQVSDLPYLINGKQATTADHTVNVGDIITFGKFEQDNNSDSWEAIQWYVIKVEGNSAMLLSVYGLDCQLFDSSTSNVTWADSDLRSWLNGDFYTYVFNDAEKNLIKSTTVKASGNAKYTAANAGSDTTDNIFVLSIDEVQQLIRSKEISKMMPTAYALARGVKYITDYAHVGDPEGYYWWLRTPGGQSQETSRYDRIALIAGDGSVDYKGTEYNDNETAVRPSLWINLE